MANEEIVKETATLKFQIANVVLQLNEMEDEIQRYLEAVKVKMEETRQRLDALQLRAQIELGDGRKND